MGGEGRWGVGGWDGEGGVRVRRVCVCVLCVCVCVCVCLHACMCVCVCTCVCPCICTRACTCTSCINVCANCSGGGEGGGGRKSGQVSHSLVQVSVGGVLGAHPEVAVQHRALLSPFPQHVAVAVVVVGHIVLDLGGRKAGGG